MGSYPEKLVVVPLENKVLLPSVILRLLIRGKQASELTKSYFRQQANKTNKQPTNDIYIACVPLRPNFEPRLLVQSLDNDGVGSQAPQVPLPSQQSRDILPHRNDQEEGDPNAIGGLVSMRDRHRLMDYGCLARIVRVQRSGTSLFGVFVEGVARFKVTEFTQNTPSMAFPGCWMAHIHYTIDNDQLLTDKTVIVRFKELSQIFVTKMRELQLPDTLLTQLTKVVNTMPVSSLADLLVSLIETTFEERLTILSTVQLEERLQKACEYMTRQLHVLQIQDSLGSGIDGTLSKRQREFYLRQQVHDVNWMYCAKVCNIDACSLS
jgi:ATP-dependent Lon protease